MSVSGPKLGRTLLTVPKVRKIFENFKASPVSEKFLRVSENWDIFSNLFDRDSAIFLISTTEITF